MSKRMLAAALGLVACGPSLRGEVAFDGRRAPIVASSADLAEVRDLPATHRRLGTVHAACVVSEPLGAPQGAWLSDVDCREARLRAALREEAAAAGGELLVGLECRSEPRGSATGERRRWITCRADVARARAGASGKSRPRDEATELGAGRAAEAWAIQVDVTPAVGVAARPARHPDSVHERAVVPPSHVRLGSVITRCDSGCSAQGTFEGLLAVAGRLGATDIAEVSCVPRGSGHLCSGTAIGYRDPAADPEAR